MHPLEVYYLNQAGHGFTTTPGIGPVYSAPFYLQRGHGIGNFFGSLFRWVRPPLWSGPKTLSRETLRTGGKLLTDIAARDDMSAGDIVSKHVTETAQNLISKLRGRGRKLTHGESVGGKKKSKNGPKINRSQRKIIKRDIFS